MVRNIINKNRETFKYIAVGLSGVVIFVSLLELFFNFGTNFFMVVASILNFLVLAILLAALIYTILVKKDELAKKLGSILLIYWTVNILLSFASPLTLFNTGNFWTIGCAIFELLALVSYVGCVALYVIALLTNKDFENIFNYVSLAHVAFMFLYFIARVIATIFTDAKFVTILNAADMVSLSFLAVIGYYLLDKKQA